MSNTDMRRLTKADRRDLAETLQACFGYEGVEELVERVARAADSQGIPDYMPHKACSEMLEVLRAQGQAVLGRLKERKAVWDQAGPSVCSLEVHKLRLELALTYRLYRLCAGQFYPLYHRALAGYAHKIATGAGCGGPSDVPAQVMHKRGQSR